MVGIMVMVMMVITMMVNYSNANDGVDYFRGNNHNGDVIMMVNDGCVNYDGDDDVDGCDSEEGDGA